MAYRSTVSICTFAQLVRGLREVFTKRNWPYVLPLAAAWVLVSGRKTVTNLIRACGLRRYFTGFHRFFSEYRWCEVELARRILEMIQLAFPSLPELELVLDDTLCPKPRGKTYGASLFNKRVKGHNSYREGHNWVIVGIVLIPPDSDRRIFFPLLADLYVRQEEMDEPETFRTKFQIAGAMIRALTKGRKTPVLVVADGAYATRPFLQALQACSAHFVGRLRKDARLYDPEPRKGKRGRPSAHGPRLPRLSYLFRGRSLRRFRIDAYGKRRRVQARAFLAYWPSVRGVIKVVAVRGLGAKDSLLFSTDLNRTAKEIILTYVGRFRIEMGIRDAKQFMGLGQGQGRTKRAVVRHVAFSLAIHSIVQVWYLKNYGDNIPRNPDPWYLHKRRPSFQDMLCALRRELAAERFPHLPTLDPKVKKAKTVILRYLQAVL